MRHGFRIKPMLITLIPIFIIFYFLNATIAFHPINPGQEFEVTAFFKDGITGNAVLETDDEFIDIKGDEESKIKDNQATWKLEGKEEGEYTLKIAEEGGDPVEKDVLITNEQKYVRPVEKYSNSIKKIEVGNEKLTPLGNFSVFGWKPGWVSIYLISSIVFSMVFRKLLKVY
jgi:hypothetical protein